MNSDGDILVGHQGKVSMVSFTDYRPDEITKHFDIPSEDLQSFHKKKGKIATSELYRSLKAKDDEIKRQNMILKNQRIKKAPPQKVRIASPTEVTRGLGGGGGILKESSISPLKGKKKIIIIGGQEFTDYEDDSNSSD